MDRIVLLCLNRSTLIYRFPSHIEYPAHHALADGHRNGPAAVGDLEATLESFGAGHGNCPNPLVPEVLLYFEHHGSRLFFD